jgi:hypothetical protein
MLLVAIGLAAGVQAARAVTVWWTPASSSCPTFDSEEDCEAYCREAPQRCGGSTDCTWKTGEKRPEC